MSDLLKNINLSDCVGDSLGKINYNILYLDTLICNISSTFFEEPDKFYSTFSDLSENIADFNTFADVFEFPTRFNLATTATKYLSSFWQKNTVTFTFPVNLYQTNDIIKSYTDTNYPDETLSIMALNKLKSFYPAKNFQINTIANVIFILHSNTTGQTTVILDKEDISVTNRYYDITARKNDVYVKEIKIAKFEINPTTKMWTFLNFIVNPNPTT